jgi:hypothetical protein
LRVTCRTLVADGVYFFRVNVGTWHPYLVFLYPARSYEDLQGESENDGLHAMEARSVRLHGRLAMRQASLDQVSEWICGFGWGGFREEEGLSSLEKISGGFRLRSVG